MSIARKTGIILLLIGICMPTATMPFITEFRPQPDLCLTSNFFGNLGNMVVTFNQGGIASSEAGSALAIPYRYLFSFGVILSCIGIGTIVLSIKEPKDLS